jgi:hypothetical protein
MGTKKSGIPDFEIIPQQRLLQKIAAGPGASNDGSQHLYWNQNHCSLS